VCQWSKVRTLTKKLFNQRMKVRVTCYPRYFVENRCEAWDEVSENGVIVFNLSNELVMVRAQLSKLSVELLGMSVCCEEMGCTGRELCHGLFEHCYVERDKLRR
jgi:hypothetical protein